MFEEKADTLPCPLYKAADWSGPVPQTSLAGPHQYDNARTVLTCLQHIKGFDIPESAAKKGLENAVWPGRLQQILHKNLPPGCELWIDGGHNESAAKALAAQAALWQQQDNKKLHLVCGMMNTKDSAAFLAPLLPYANTVTCTAVPGETLALPAQTLAATARVLGGKQVSDNPDPLAAIHNAAAGNTRVLVAGSLYLAGYALKSLFP